MILDFSQARDAARKWFVALERNEGRRTGKCTVSDALDDYLAGFQGKDLANTRRRIEAIVRPQMGKHEVAKLTTKAINDWLVSLANAAARVRTAKGAEQQYRETADTDEARRLVNACDPSFRPLVQAALLTGARYSELAALEARDFDRQSQTIWLRETEAGVARAVYLEGEGVELFDQATIGKSANDLIFPRPDGKRWGPSQQSRPLAAACKAAKLAPTGFHDLRRTYGARLALRGVPMAVIAEALGHADERITGRL